MRKMRPLKLRISGLNSFVEEQVIDFERLTERGLFGIFGPTGSGKSTIIDAITLSMYGKIPRNSREFINTNSTSTSVSYEFEIGIGAERKRYIVERNIKKDLKTGGYKTTLARIREMGEKGEKVLCEGDREVQKKIAEIIGLTAEDFTRSVVLPQGKFSDFLKLTGKDRRDMLERIFGLEKYGNNLLKKIREVKNEKNLILNRVSGELSRYEGVSSEALQEMTKKLEILKGQEEKLAAEKNRLDLEKEKLKAIWEKQQELNQYLQKKELLERKIEEIERKKVKIKKAEKALSVKPYIDAANETSSKIAQNKEEVEKYTKELTVIEENLKKIEKEYDIALQKKEEKIPLLIEKEEKLKRALQIQKEVKTINEEREKLLKTYRAVEKEIEKLKKELEILSNDIEITKKVLEDKDKKIEELKISSGQREKIFSALEVQKEFERIEKDKKEKEAKIFELEEAIKRQQKEHERLKNLIKQKEEEIQALEEKIRNLEGHMPPTSDELLIMQQQLEEQKSKFLEAKENDELRQNIKGILNEISDLKGKLKEQINKLEDDIKTKSKQLENLTKEIEEIQRQNIAGELAKDLEEGMPCPVCGSVHHVKLAQKIDEELINEKRAFEEIFKREIEEFQNQLLKLKGELVALEAKEEFHKKEYDRLEEKLKGIDIKAFEQNVGQLQLRFEKAKLKTERWNKEKEEINALLKKLGEEKAQLDLEEARLKESLGKDVKALKELKVSVEELSRAYSCILDQLESLRTELEIRDFKQKVVEINEKDREVEKLQKESELLEKKLEELVNKKEILSNKINELLIKKAQIVEIGKEKSKYLQERQKEIDILSEGKEIENYLKEVQRERENILKEEKILKEQFENEKKKKQETENKKVSALENQILLNNMLKDQFEKLNASISKNGFKDEKEVMECFLDEGTIKSLEEEIKNFENEYISICSNIERLDSTLNGQRIEEEVWRNLEEKIKETEQALTEKRKEIGATQKTLEDIQNNLQKVEELTEQKKELEQLLDMLEDLDKLFQGNHFVEFVATRQLKLITFSASKRLKEITRGRYALELDSDNNFVMRDDFNGGTRRSVDTLSGGETFLTSLSLALALSSHIQLKGRAPLEFFFLDEGFGSLDSELLDVVMTSLERLRNDKMVVGIISHVEELKNRVPVKLIIIPPSTAGEGSKVRIEYS
jgi:exonuclease SbcC